MDGSLVILHRELLMNFLLAVNSLYFIFNYHLIFMHNLMGW